MVDKSQSIFVEYCVNCSNHAWCTKHDESKYRHFYDIVEQGLQQEFPSFTVYGNHNPYTGKSVNPRLGAFEITFQDKVVFSKLKTSMWPTMDALIHRIKLVQRGRNPTEYNGSEPPQKNGRQSSRSSRRTPVRGRAQLPGSNHSFLDGNEDHGSMRDRDYPIMQMTSKNQTTGGRGLPYVNNGLMKRELTPTRLEGIGVGSHFFDERQHHVKLAYLDANRKIVNMTKDNQYDFLQRKYDTEAMSPVRTLYDSPSPYSYTTMSNNSPPMFAQRAEMIPQQQDDVQRITDNYRKSGSVPIPKRRNRDDSGAERQNESTLHTDKTLKTEESEIRPKNREKMSPMRTFTSRMANGSKLPVIANVKNQKNILQGVFVFRGKIIQEKDLLGLDSVEFPEQKFSEIKVPKEGLKKKKITMIADTSEDCKIDIYSTTPEILAMEANDIAVSKGSLFKIALKFSSAICDGMRECYLFLFKDNKPWIKILIQLTYI